jgi:hypothetical protein
LGIIFLLESTGKYFKILYQVKRDLNLLCHSLLPTFWDSPIQLGKLSVYYEEKRNDGKFLKPFTGKAFTGMKMA